MFQRSLGLALAVLLIAGTTAAASRVQDIPDGWKPAGLRPLSVANATASSALGPQYAPALAVDGNRGTKWVATVAPSHASPQWITLKLPFRERVTAVAVFGERAGNDGILDGAIQVAAKAADRFTTVARIEVAKSGRWVARFDPVEAAAVRLLVTRSSGPSTHTDVYEIKVFGCLLSPRQLKVRTAEHLATGRKQLQAAKVVAAKLGPHLNRFLAEATGDIESRAEKFDNAASQYVRWNQLTKTQRGQLAERMDKLLLLARRLPACLARVADVWPERAKDVAAVRQAAEKVRAVKKIIVGRDDGRVRLVSHCVVVDLDATKGTWQATWLGKVSAALRGAGFCVEVDGREFRPAAVKAEVRPMADKLGTGLAIVQRWGKEIEVERRLQLYRNRPDVVVAATITNRTDHDVSLGTMRLLDLSANAQGWWYAGQCVQTPAAVTVAGLSQLICEPIGAGGDPPETERNYAGTGLLLLAHQDPAGALAAGFLTGLEARPELHARFRPADGGTALSAQQRFLGRKLRPGATLQLDPVCVSAGTNPYAVLEQYGDNVAAMSRLPVRRGPTSIWCSWYAHRMAMTEELVLANAAVAARHFKPLGMQIIQLDHGWQRGDVTGDWVANERFPHGLKWLAEQLRSRYGLRLGLWIAPTDVADVARTFKKHPDWMLKDKQGKPRVNWRWYWKPNPNCYELDVSRPQAAKFLEQTFARLSTEGSSYYKIDFIAASGGEQFHPFDPYCTPGWGVLRRAMEAIRQGAGPDAWIRYCQTPPLLSVGLANSAYGGADTSDAGTPGVIDTLRANARSLAAGYWINDRLYHREVCDMSVGMRGPLWEARMKMTMMCLAGCSVSFSDELQYLPPSRLHMMQRCLPPGGPPMKPIDLFERTIPSIWHIHCKRDFGQWEVVGLLNLTDEPRERTVEFTALGLDRKTDVVVFECWEEELLGAYRDHLTVRMPPRTSRILFLHRLSHRPQVIGTNMHLLGGYHELEHVVWNASTHRLAGRCRRMAGIAGTVYVFVPDGYQPHFDFPLAQTSARMTNVGNGLWMKELRFDEASVDWSIPFDGPNK